MDALFEDLRALVDQRVQQAFNDLLRADVAAPLDTVLARERFADARHLGIEHGLAALVAVVAGAGLLAVTAQFEQLAHRRAGKTRDLGRLPFGEEKMAQCLRCR